MAEQTIAEIVAEQRATKADLEYPADPPPSAPAPAPVEAAPEPVAEAVEAAPEPAPEAAPEPTPEPEAKRKKTPVDYLTGRVGNLNQTLATERAEKAALQARLEAAERLLHASGTPTPDGSPPAPAPNQAFTPQDWLASPEGRAAVARQAQAEALNTKANAVYDSGTQAFPDFQETVATLNALGVMSGDFIEAAIEAAGDEKTSAAIFHALGSDVEEAQRIASLPPVRMGVELAKMAAKVTQTQTPAPRVSSAPAPIPSIRGPVEPVIDLARASEGEGNDMSAWVSARVKAGDPYARPARRH